MSVNTKSRDDFKKSVVDAACKRAAYICSNPNCRVHTLAPSKRVGAFLYIGKVAHISAAAKGGPRYDENISSTERSSINNALFLCSSCADLIDKNNGADFHPDQLRAWKSQHEEWVAENLNKRLGVGGNGGGGTIFGNRGTVVGGKGGQGGASGVGGHGGSGTVHGDDALIIGGDGASAGTSDGRGGRAGRGPTERLGIPTPLWGFGRGGAGQNAPEYDRRLRLLKQIRFEYLQKFPQDAQFIDAGVDEVPCDWVNQRLTELGESWCITPGERGYQLPPLC